MSGPGCTGNPCVCEENRARRSTPTDTAQAFDELQAWILRDPANRYVRRIARNTGAWTVGLQAGEEEITASKDAELRGAIRNALMIAGFAGYR